MKRALLAILGLIVIAVTTAFVIFQQRLDAVAEFNIQNEKDKQAVGLLKVKVDSLREVILQIPITDTDSLATIRNRARAIQEVTDDMLFRIYEATIAVFQIAGSPNGILEYYGDISAIDAYLIGYKDTKNGQGFHLFHDIQMYEKQLVEYSGNPIFLFDQPINEQWTFDSFVSHYFGEKDNTSIRPTLKLAMITGTILTMVLALS